jgi:serine/threonine-protein kinase RsbW
MNQATTTHYPVRVSIPSDLEEARQLQDQIERQILEVGGFSESDIFAIKMALEEALVNAIKHGNQMDRSKKVHIEFRLESGHFEVRIADEGAGFDPDDVPNCTDPENLERPCGRGLLLMRHYMNRIDYIPPGNVVVMSKISQNGKA